jgi:multidrug efflux system membrane fusion protein
MKFGHPVVRNILLGAAVTLLLDACAKDEPKPDVVRPVRTMTLASKNGDVLTFAGEVKPRHETRLAFRVPGQILDRRVEVGAVVKTGQVLVVLDANDLRLAETASRAQLAQAQSQAALAEADFKRYAELRAKSFISQAEFERREAQVKQAREVVAAARAESERFSNQVGYGALLAPHAGVITAVEAETGQVVAAGQPVVRIARLEEREIAFNVPEQLLEAVRRAKDIEVRLWSKPELSYPGRLRELSPVADSASRTYPARLSIVKGDRELVLGMTAEVRARTTHAETLRLPLSAVFHQQDRPAVWVVEGDPAAVRLVPIDTGAVRGDTVEIVSGLTSGQVVVTAGVHMLAPGQKVRLLGDNKRPDSPS